MVTLPGPTYRTSFGSKAKTVLFLARFERSFEAWQVYRCTQDELRADGMENYTAEIRELVARVQVNLELRGDDEQPEDYRVGDDPLLDRVRRQVKTR